MNLNLSAEQQRIFILIGVGVVAVAGLFLVTRGGAGESGSTPSTPPAKSSPAQPGQEKTKTSPSQGSAEGGQAKSAPEQTNPGEESAVKPSKQAYLDCVQQATSTAALEKCQAVLP